MYDEELDERLKKEVHLDKAWHGIHYLLTGSGWEGEEPLGYLLGGGQAIGGKEADDSSPRALLPEEVAAFDTALSQIMAEDLRQRFNPKEMIEQYIYPVIWDRDPEEDDTLGYLLVYFDILKTFVRKTRDANKGLIIFLG